MFTTLENWLEQLTFWETINTELNAIETLPVTTFYGNVYRIANFNPDHPSLSELIANIYYQDHTLLTPIISA